MTRPQAVATQVIDDTRVTVTRFDFAQDAETGWHVHGMDYVITTLTHCTMMLVDADGHETTRDVPAGTSYRRDAGVAHNVINAGDAPMAFVEVELK